MNYQAELTFLKKILEQYNLNVYEILNSTSEYAYIDKGIRHFLGLENAYSLIADKMKTRLNSSTIYNISDDFFSNYFLMELPNEAEPLYLIVGPYTEKNFTRETLVTTLEKYIVPPNILDSIMQYYASIPFLADPTAIRILLSTFWETVWNNSQNCIFEEIQLNLPIDYSESLPNTFFENITEANDISFKMQLIEERYQVEGKLIKYVSQGNYEKASAVLSGLNNFIIERRSNTRLRDYKNYTIILNTLLRKGAEAGAVHPIHIDSLSSYFAKKIETITSLEQGEKLFHEMIRKYCFLVKNHSLKEYSLLVQKVVTRIDADLTVDQSLKTHASLLNVHPSYLSTLFRKETGVTLTDYVNQKRVEHGVFLLNTTNMQIQTVAQHCGVPDINYFTRIFKKQVGKTPSEYKKTLRN